MRLCEDKTFQRVGPWLFCPTIQPPLNDLPRRNLPTGWRSASANDPRSWPNATHGRDALPRVRLYTDLTADEADALNARTPLRDVYGNPYDRATWFSGSLLYAFD